MAVCYELANCPLFLQPKIHFQVMTVSGCLLHSQVDKTRKKYLFLHTSLHMSVRGVPLRPPLTDKKIGEKMFWIRGYPPPPLTDFSPKKILQKG